MEKSYWKTNALNYHFKRLKDSLITKDLLQAEQEFFQLGQKIIEESFKKIKEQELEVIVTHDFRDLNLDDKDKIYLLCNGQNIITDLTPLLDFVSRKKRKKYEQLKKYLSN